MKGAQREGIALVTTLLVLIAVASVAAAAGILSYNNQLIASANDRSDLLEAVADAGLERARAVINGDDVVPAEGYVMIEDSVRPTNALGDSLAAVRRWTYVGPRGITTGQYGVFASVVSVVEGPAGDRMVRRLDLLQHSFARYAYFTDTETSSIGFGGGDQLFGPVHSNDGIRIYDTGATFNGPLTTGGTISGESYGTYRDGYAENVAKIPMPTTADLDELQLLAADADMHFDLPGGWNLRLEFLALDVNNDGDTTDADEGFIAAYRSTDWDWLVANEPSSYYNVLASPNCGRYDAPANDFEPVLDESSWGARYTHLQHWSRRCFLGGDPRLWSRPWEGSFIENDGTGRWIPYPGSVDPTLSARFGETASYLFPLSRLYNPEFKGVIHVTGNVVVSGTLRGRVTLAATGDIILGDDLVYATNPAAPGREVTCDDMLGLFAGSDVVIADNVINAPRRLYDGENPHYTFDDSADELINGTVLALSNFRVQNHSGPSPSSWSDFGWVTAARSAEPCDGVDWGRGCLRLTGGVIQDTRGPVGTSGQTGYLKRYSYDRCAAIMPPPYFPTTGHYTPDRYFSVDPVGFDLDAYFDRLAAGG